MTLKRKSDDKQVRSSVEYLKRSAEGGGGKAVHG